MPRNLHDSIQQLASLDRRQLLTTASKLGVAGSIVGTSVEPAAATPGDEIWKYEIGSGIFSSPTVFEDTVYIGSKDQSLYALEKTTGEPKWQYSTNGGVYSPPTVVDNVVFVGSRDGSIYALDATNGTELWTFETQGDIFASPAVKNNTVFFSSLDGSFYAVNAGSGEVEWDHQIGGGGLGKSPTLVDETVYVSGESLFAFDIASGEVNLQYEPPNTIVSSPTVANDRVIVKNSDQLVAININSGEVEWSFGDNLGISSPTVFNETVYFGGRNKSLYAVDLATGMKEWQYKLPYETELRSSINSSPTVADGTVFMGSVDGDLYAVDVDSGKEEWIFETDGTVSSSPTVADGTLFVGTFNGTVNGIVYAVDAGVSGSSEGSRVLLGTLGHHDGWRHADQTITSLDTRENSVQTEGATDGTQTNSETDEFGLSTTIIGAGVIGGLGIGAYRALQTQSTRDAKPSTRETQQAPTPDSSATNTSDEPSYPTTKYADYEHGDVIAKKDIFDIVEATVAGFDERVALYSLGQATGTVKSKLVDSILDGLEDWNKIDEHPHIATVYDYGHKPIPWFAVEITDRDFVPEEFSDYTVETKQKLISQLCEGVHHGHRHGLKHGDLTSTTISINITDTPSIRISDWGISSLGGDQGRVTQQDDLEQIVSISYQLFTGEECPTDKSLIAQSSDIQSLPGDIPEIFEHAWKNNGYDTALHFRDAIRQGLPD